MAKTIDDFVKTYYPTKTKMEQLALKSFVKEYCGEDATLISNALKRAGVTSIYALYDLDVCHFSSMRCIGDKRLKKVREMQLAIKSYLEQ